MKVYYILGTSKTGYSTPRPQDYDLLEVAAESFQEAVKLASEKSDKRYFCALDLKPVNLEVIQ